MSRRRIVIHPGFHKTGTTTIQRFLYENRKAIFPSHAIGLNWRFRDLVHATRGYSTWRDEGSLTKAALRLAEFIARLDLPPGRGLVISAEALAGHLPGRERVADYGALPALMPEVVAVLSEAFGDGFELAVHLSTRAPAPWLDSAWAEHVKGSRMRLDLDDFRARFAGAADLEGIAARLAEAIAPWPVHSARLEDCASLPFGPATPLVELMALPEAARAKLRPVPAHNARLAPEVLEELLALNRSDLGPEALRDAKMAVLSAGPTQ